ncbi:Autotransporter-associated beta strand repeat protein [Posidoniimonas corsicana]|uniref:Autotransporter-associated beta strand repeat protein n=1 Tax=Posidoniimonas corsicana TaxID=1938618 RepID=A0A5C5VG25_9BACT|nr:LamG domain-containing protein [Posidoniimonas corsicana]TWT36859.1 Autotransporter-associated beta strand repeat protein [Posidoniimonas corsicana]
MNYRILAPCVALCCAALACGRADAQLTFSLAWGWQGDARQDAAWTAMNNIVNRYNAYGDFTGGNGSHVQAAYNPGVPTAQAGYGGWGGIIEYGGTWPNDRVTMHELDHWLGTGTYSNAQGRSWDGQRAVSILEQFDGVGARVGTDGVHFWPYGMNYDNEWSELNARRNVALVYALRADWGIGSTANPTAWNATSVSLAGSDPVGRSGFNHYSSWSDGEFAHPNADYSTGAHDLRTPNGYPSWTFAGRSLTVNPGGRLLYNGWGHDGRVTFKNLIVDNATVRHDQYDLDTFRLAGAVTLTGDATFDAGQGDIFIEAAVTGAGSLVKTGAHDLTLQASNDYAGATTISRGTLRLAPTRLVAEYTFDNVRGDSVVNLGAGGAPMNGVLANGATIVPAGGGREGSAVSLANGASVNINNGVTDLAPDGNWAVSTWIKTASAGGALLSKTNGGWEYGNTAFFLGDGLGAGSGGQPAGVRWAGGFLQTRARGTIVTDDQWRQVTYVNNGGVYTIYIDGEPLMATRTDSGFSNADIGSMVQLGVANNPGDGALNFNGLMDSVQIYGQSLSAAQAMALYEGQRLGTLPSTTTVSVASGATLDVNGVTQEIAGLDGAAGSSVLLGNRGHLIVNSAADAAFAGVISGSGAVTKSGAGTLTLAGANTLSGITTVAAGVLELDGRIGPTKVDAGATLRGDGQVVGGLTLAAGSTLAVDVAASTDLLAVTGAATLDGVLDVTLDAGFTPTLNDTFTVLTAASLVNNLTLGGPDASLFSLMASTATEVILTAVSGLPGDYNNDGLVDAADYTVWRDNQGAAEWSLPNDFNGGPIGAEQYAAWRSNFGANAAFDAAAASVPEPTAAVAAALLAWPPRRRRPHAT